MNIKKTSKIEILEEPGGTGLLLCLPHLGRIPVSLHPDTDILLNHLPHCHVLQTIRTIALYPTIHELNTFLTFIWLNLTYIIHQKRNYFSCSLSTH
jgi:hypothetical protein